MIRKVTGSAAARAKANGGRSKPKGVSTPQMFPVEHKEPESDKVAESIEAALNELSSMFAQHLTVFSIVVQELRDENRALKEGQVSLQEEIKALREREVELIPDRDRSGEIERIIVKPIAPTQH